jgi:hypothetical protein
MSGFALGLPEASILFVIAVLGIIPWIAGIWALITLNRIKNKVEAIERHLRA